MTTVAELNVLISANPTGLRSALGQANREVQGFGGRVKSSLDSRVWRRFKTERFLY